MQRRGQVVAVRHHLCLGNKASKVVALISLAGCSLSGPVRSILTTQQSHCLRALARGGEGHWLVGWMRSHGLGSEWMRGALYISANVGHQSIHEFLANRLRVLQVRYLLTNPPPTGMPSGKVGLSPI